VQSLAFFGLVVDAGALALADGDDEYDQPAS
jgi:hypothetical protein